jgi:hypothetical protein
MKKLLLFAIAAFACAPLFAQPVCTTVSDSVYSVGVAAPVLMTGTIDLSLGYSAADGSFVVVSLRSATCLSRTLPLFQ